MINKILPRFIKFVTDIKLQTRFNIIFGILICGLFILAYVSYATASGILIKQSEKNSINLLAQTGAHFTLVLEGYSEFVYGLSRDAELSEILENLQEETDPTIIKNNLSKGETLLNTALRNRQDIINMFIFFRNREYVIGGKDFSISDYNEFYELPDIQDYFEKNDSRVRYWTEPYETENTTTRRYARRILSLYYSILPINKLKPVGIIQSNIKEDILKNVLSPLISDYENTVFLINNEHEIIFNQSKPVIIDEKLSQYYSEEFTASIETYLKSDNTDPDNASSKIFTIELNGKKEKLLMTSFPLTNLDWILINVIPIENITRSAREAQYDIFLYGSIILIITIILNILFSRDVVNSIKILIGHMQEVTSGTLDDQLNWERNDEIGTLAKEFDFMRDTIRGHIDTLNILVQSYERFVPVEFLNQLGRMHITHITLGDNTQKNMAIMFADIRAYTTLSEKMAPEENFKFLNSYLQHVSPIIRNNNGFIDKFIGDAIMALFSEPLLNVVYASIDFQREIRKYNEGRHKAGYELIRVGIGIHAGLIMLGTVGEPRRMDGTVISDAVNVAARIERLTKYYQVPIICSDTIISLITEDDDISYRRLDRVKILGREKPETIFEILDATNEVDNLKIQTKTQFEHAADLYQKMEFNESLHLFNEIAEKNQNDLAAVKYIERLEQIISQGLPEDWDGIERRCYS
jgi:class 3 adenylate cyclase